MSTATTSDKSDRYVDFDEYVEFQLEKTRKSIKTNDLLTAIAAAAALVLAGILAFVVLDHWVISGGFGLAARWCWFVGFAGLVTGWLVWKVGIPAVWTVNRLFAAKELEHADPKLKGNLLNWVDLRAAGRTVNASVMQTMEKQAATELSKMDVGQAVDHRPLLSASYALLAIVVLFCGYALLSPKKISSALWRILPFTTSGAVTRTVIQEVTPGDATLLARGQLEVGVLIAGEIPHEVQLLYSTADGRIKDEAVILRPETEGLPRFRGIFAGESGNGVLQDFSYFIVAGDAKSSRFRVTVHQPPSATVHQVSLKSPEYMLLEDSTSHGGHIDGWEGAIATISATSDKPCRSAILQFLNDPQSPPTGEEVPVTVTDGTQLAASWKLDFRSDGTFPRHYRIQCRNDAGEVDPSPAVYNIAIKPDRPPEVALLFPERDLEAPANAVIPLLVQASDPDFELGYINLLVEKDGQPLHRSPLSEGRQKSLTLKHNLELAGLALQPGEEIQFWVEAFDNKHPRRNRKNTPRLKIRIVEPVSKEQAEQQLADNQQERDTRLAEAQQEQNPQEDRQENADTENAEQLADRDPQDRDTEASQQTADKPDGSAQSGGSNTQNARDNSADNSEQNSRTAAGAGDSGKHDAEQKTDNTDDTQNSPLDPGGEDDAEALRRLNERLNPQPERPSKNPDKGQKQPDQSTGKNPSPQPKNPAANADPADEESNPDGDQPPSQSEKPTKSKQKPPRTGSQSQASDEAQTGDQSDPNQTDAADTPSESDADPQRKPDQQPAPKSQPSRGKKTTGEEAASDPLTGEDSPADQSEDPKPAAGVKNQSTTGRKPPKSDDTANESPENNAPSTNVDESDSDPSVPRPDETEPGEKPAPGKSTDPMTKPGKDPAAEKEPQPKKKPSGTQPKDPKQNKPDDESDASSRESEDSDSASNDAVAPNDDQSAASEKQPNSTPKSKSPSQSGKSPKSTNSSTASDSESSPSGEDESSDSGGDDSASASESSSTNQPSKTKPSSKPGKNQPQQNSPSQKQPGTAKPGEKEAAAGNDEASESPSESASDGSENKRPGAGSETKPDEPKSPPKAGKNNPNAKKTELENPAETADGEQPSPSARQHKPGDPNAADEEMKGEGEPDGQTSDQPEGGEAGGSKQDREGNPGSETEGPGEQTDKPGDETVAKEKTGKPDPRQRPGQGTETKPGDKDAGGEQPGGESGKKQAKKPGKKEGKLGDKPGSEQGTEPAESSQAGQQPSGSQPQESGEEGGGGEGAEGTPNGSPSGAQSKNAKPGNNPKPGGKKPGGTSNPQGGDATENGDVLSGDNPVETEIDPEAANLEFNRQAAELVLQRLKDDLNNDQVDPKLLEELGWTPAQLQRFVERLARQLEKPAEELTPQDEARRRQFEEMLKSLDLKNSGARRTGGNDPKRELDQTGARRAPVAAEYKASWEALTKSLSKKTPTGKKDAEKGPKR